MSLPAFRFPQPRTALGGGVRAHWVNAEDRIRCKVFNSVPNLQFKLVLKFFRANKQYGEGSIHTVTKIITPSSDRAVLGNAGGNTPSFPFGAAAAVGRSVSDAVGTSGSAIVTSATAAFVAGDVGKYVTLAAAGTSGTAGPDFPSTLYQGAIIGVSSGTTISVQPNVRATVSAANLIIEPTLLSDIDGLELGSGWLLGVDCNFWQGGPRRGECFIDVELNRGAFNKNEGITLVAAYLSTSQHISWPNGRVEDKVSGKGLIRGVTLANPAVGTDWTFTVPVNARWKIVSGSALLTAGTSVATRQVTIIADDATNIFHAAYASGTQVASQGHRYNFAPGLDRTMVNTVLGNTAQFLPLPDDLELRANWRLRSSTANLSAPDQWSQVNLQVEEWIEEGS